MCKKKIIIHFILKVKMVNIHHNPLPTNSKNILPLLTPPLNQIWNYFKLPFSPSLVPPSPSLSFELNKGFLVMVVTTDSRVSFHSGKQVCKHQAGQIIWILCLILYQLNIDIAFSSRFYFLSMCQCHFEMI